MKKESGFLWDSSKGPFENLLSLGQGAVMLFGPIHMKVITGLATLFDLDLSALGKKIDEILNLRQIEDIDKITPENAAETFAPHINEMLATAAFTDFKNGIYKKSFIKEAGLVGMLVSFFATAFKWIKRLAIGAGGLWAMEQIKDSKEKGSEPASSSPDGRYPDLSIKRSPNTYKQNLEGRIDKILSE